MGNPWLHIIGLGDDGVQTLPEASRDALARAEFVFGGGRHLDLVAGMAGAAQLRPWPNPYRQDAQYG